jgi:hypothetical protein
MQTASITIQASVVDGGETKALSSAVTFQAYDVASSKQDIGNTYETILTIIPSVAAIIYNPSDVDVSLRLTPVSGDYIFYNIVAGGIFVLPRFTANNSGQTVMTAIASADARTASGTATLEICSIF